MNDKEQMKLETSRCLGCGAAKVDTYIFCCHSFHSRSGETDLECAGGGRAVEFDRNVIRCAGCHSVSYLEIPSVAVVVTRFQRRLG